MPVVGSDLFSTVARDSVVRQTFSGAPISLPDLVVEPFVFDDYRVRDFQFPVADHHDAVMAATHSIMRPILHRGYAESFTTAVYEAILNAHQHGNKLDPTKKVIVGTKLKDTKVKVAVADEGGVIVPEFAAYVLHQREENSPRKPFYDFAEQPKPTEKNLGRGTSFMHMQSSSVAYHKGENGGLVVLLTKYIA